MRIQSKLKILILLIMVVCMIGCTRVVTEKPKSERWWKGNLHTHSFWSDGEQFPEMAADWYKQHGYNFLALSEHNLIAEGMHWIKIEDQSVKSKALEKYIARFGQPWVKVRKRNNVMEVRLKTFNECRQKVEEKDRFILIPAEEVTAEKMVHVNSINCKNLIIPVEGETPAEILQNNLNAVNYQRIITNRAMLSIVNHPNFDWALTAEDIMNQKNVRFIEVYNGASGRFYEDQLHPSSERKWDIILAKRLGELNLPVVYGVASDDTHHYSGKGCKRWLPGRGWVMVRASQLNSESIVRSMQAGKFYLSTGITIKDLRFDGKTLRIDIQSESGVDYTTRFIGTFNDYDSTSEPVFDKSGNSLRVTRIYSKDIGRTIKEVKGNTASYKFTGKELYVRAIVISSRLKINNSIRNEHEMAWIQPCVPAISSK